jgi:DUF4097 and DUF4098 domain-containing protein YvlB
MDITLRSTDATRTPRAARTLRAALCITTLCALAAPPVLAGEVKEERFEKAYELGGINKVRVQNVNGPVHIESWEKDILKVIAVKKAKGSRADEELRDTEIKVTKQGASIEIETVLPKNGRILGLFNWSTDRGADVTYDLYLPASMAVDIETVNGKITAEKREGALTLNTVNGSVRVEGQGGPLHVNTVNGSVEVAFAGASKPADLETVNGSVTVSCAKDSSFRYDLQTVNGRIKSEFADLDVKGKWGPKEARGEINGGRDRLAVETVNGEVRLQVADAASARPKS